MKYSILYIAFVGSIVFLGSMAYSQDSSRLSGLPTVYTVHIDEVMLENMKRFEALDKAQIQARNKILQEHNLPIAPGYEFSTSTGTYFSLRPRTAYGELDKPTQYSDDVRKLMAEQVNPYSDTVHTFLRYHHNEIWKLDLSGSYLPKSFNPDPSVIKYVHLRTEWVKPPMNELYDSIQTLFRQALEKRRYPLACMAFFSQYGNGANLYLWHARNLAEYVGTPTAEQILIGAYGKERGSKLYSDWQDCLLNAEDIDADIRPDLTGGRADQSWFGISR